MKAKIFIYLGALLWVLNAIAAIPSTTDDTWPAEYSFIQDTEFISLFNGKDFTGWGFLIKAQEGIIFESLEGCAESKDKRFVVNEGLLTANSYKEGNEVRYLNLWTEKEFPEDFLLTLEFRASKDADSGIFLRGKQLQCRNYAILGPYKNLKNYKEQDWNKIEVVVKNNIAHCTCNGEVLEEAMTIPSTGPIGLESDRGQMEYRNIRLKELE